ncbi:MAG: 4Fe-4S dicluster domain-containing protein [Candidatus Kapabacteria bacterium]|nr:4Fe-4S dicluster domain-containing protein [Candidatus Kapabacteria bacterium]
MSEIRWGMLVDLRRCIGCHTCTIACKCEFAVPLGGNKTWVKTIEKGQFPNVSRSFLPSFCNNCENPICVRNCPTQATFKRADGIVMQDPHRCIGCKYCMASCPYDVRYVDPLKKVVQKCTWCHHRLDAGVEPACVGSCPSSALIFGDVNDPESKISKMLSANAIQVLKTDKDTHPHVFYVAADEVVMRATGGANRKEKPVWWKWLLGGLLFNKKEE